MLKPDRIKSLPKFELLRFDSEEGRTYGTPEGERHSVTSVLDGTKDKQKLMEWREWVGEEKADMIRDLAAFRGTKLHEAVEEYLLSGKEPPFSFTLNSYWKSARLFLPRVEHPVIMEAPVWHPDGYAGTLDCIAYLDDDDAQPTLLDWKTADKVCKPPKIYEYSLQLAAYRAAANHVYRPQGLNIQRAVLVVALLDQAPQIEEFDEDALDQLYLHFQGRLGHFIRARS